MNDEERIREYVRSRADVRVPADLRWPAPGGTPRRGWAPARASAWAIGAVVIAVVVVVGGFVGVSQSAAPDHSPGPSPRTTAELSNGTFPSEVAGLPVITVAHALELLQAGQLDGQAVAVAGYYGAAVASCPSPGRYIGPLEGYCRFVAFADTRAAAQLCQPEGSNGQTCRQASGIHLEPFFMSETSARLPGGSSAGPLPVVLIGHAGDPRQWQCTPATQAACARAFVVERIAWAEGHDVQLAAPETGDLQSGRPITPRMTLAQVATSVGVGNAIVTAAPFRARDIGTIDPRWNRSGDDIVWLVRSLAAAPTPVAETRPETVSLVDDATAKVIDSHPLKLDATFQPARLWVTATVHGADCCAGNEVPFTRVQSSGGTVVYDGLISGGSSGGPGYTTYGGGYGSLPLVLPAGSYTITTWLADFVNGSIGTPRRACSTQIALASRDVVTANADFPAGERCTFRAPPSPSPGP